MAVQRNINTVPSKNRGLIPLDFETLQYQFLKTNGWFLQAIIKSLAIGHKILKNCKNYTSPDFDFVSVQFTKIWKIIWFDGASLASALEASVTSLRNRGDSRLEEVKYKLKILHCEDAKFYVYE